MALTEAIADLEFVNMVVRSLETDGSSRPEKCVFSARQALFGRHLFRAPSSADFRVQKVYTWQVVVRKTKASLKSQEYQ